MARIDIVGKTFGLLTVLFLDEEKNAKLRKERNMGLRSNAPVHYICRCKCGNKCSVTSQKLRNGYTKSCGCLVKKYDFEDKSYEGKTYGGYTIIRYYPNNENNKHYFLCKCQCGAEKIVDAYNLIKGLTNNCGCMKSVNNLKMCNILDGMNIKYEKEYYFNTNGKRGYFDIFIPSLNVAIEYDGQDHYIPIDRSGNNMENEKLKIVQERDERKNNYCKENNIQLLRIPYWDKNNIEEIIYNFINKITLND